MNKTDISAAEALQYKEKFTAVFDGSPAMMVISTPEGGQFIDVSQSLMDILGYEKSELIGRTSVETGMFFDVEERRHAYDLFLKDRSVNNLEVKLRKKNGEAVFCILSIRTIHLDGKTYLMTTAIDISRQKMAEEKLNHLFIHQKLIADISQLINHSFNLEKTLPDVLKVLGEHTEVSRIYIFENDPEGKETSNTYEWCDEGIAPQKDELQHIPYEMIPAWKIMLLEEGRVYSTDITQLPEEIYQMLKPQGILSILVYPLFVQDRFFGFIGFDECKLNRDWNIEEMELLRTISNILANGFERRESIKKTAENELRLNLALESGKEGLWDWNIQTGALFVNDVWCTLLGYDPKAFVPNVDSWQQRVHPDDVASVLDLLNKHLEGKSSIYEAIYRAKTSQGEWRWILDHGMVVEYDKENKPVRAIGTNIDITAQKKIEEELQESIRTKNKLFSIIAHDLRGPIGNLTPIIDLLTSSAELDEETRNLFVDELKTTTKNTFGLLENLLNWSRTQTNSISLSPEYFSINDVIRDSIDLLSTGAGQKGITFVSPLPERILVYADCNSITLVVRNLLSNAIKFTPQGGTITVTLQDGPEKVVVSIHDTGVGMKPEVLEKLFKPNTFYTTYGTNQEKGSGLGLVLCKDFVLRNGGEIRVESEPSKGSTFQFSIPKNSLR